MRCIQGWQRRVPVAKPTANALAHLQVSDDDKPLVALAFKLEEGRFGQLTYMRVYQGTMRRGDMIHNINRKQKIKVRASEVAVGLGVT